MSDYPTIDKLDAVWEQAMERDAKLVSWHMDYTTYQELQREDRFMHNFSFQGSGPLLRGLPLMFHAYTSIEDLSVSSSVPYRQIAKREPFMLALSMKNRLDRVFYIDHEDCHKEWLREGKDA